MQKVGVLWMPETSRTWEDRVVATPTDRARRPMLGTARAIRAVAKVIARVDPVALETGSEDRYRGGPTETGQRRSQHGLRTAVPAGTVASPAFRAVKADRAETLRVAVSGLEDPYREVVSLRYFAGFTVREIAAVTGRSEAVIMSHLHRGLIRLTSKLERPRGRNLGAPKCFRARPAPDRRCHVGDALAISRELERYVDRFQHMPSVGLADRVMSAIAAEPLPGAGCRKRDNAVPATDSVGCDAEAEPDPISWTAGELG